MLMSDAGMWMVYVYMCVCLLAHTDTLGLSAALLHRGGSGVLAVHRVDQKFLKYRSLSSNRTYLPT